MSDWYSLSLAKTITCFESSFRYGIAWQVSPAHSYNPVSLSNAGKPYAAIEDDVIPATLCTSSYGSSLTAGARGIR